MHGPMDQFLVKTIVPLSFLGIDISITNASLFMTLASALSMALLYFGTVKKEIIPGRTQSVVEIIYEFITSMIKDSAGREGIKYFPFIFSLFMFVLFGNLLGMIPFGYTITSQIVVTFALAFCIFAFVTGLGFAKQGTGFFRMFFPKGSPLALAPVLIPIEIISYMLRPITLSVRLFANMMAGHLLIKVIAGFAVSMVAAGGVLQYFSIAPVIFTVILVGFEFFVAAIQAYIFTILTCLYLNDALHGH